MTTLTTEQKAAFNKDGFLILDKYLSPEMCDQLRNKFQTLFRGEFETGVFPDEWHWREGLSLPDITREMVNVWKCDLSFAKVVLSADLGSIISQLGGWDGARVGQDDIWWKPPGSKEVAFHQDSTYFSFLDPSDVITAWIALEDTQPEAGTLEFVKGSHLWTLVEKISDQFFSPDDWKKALREAAVAAAVKPESLEFVPVVVPKGGIAFHHGRLWHGSGSNKTLDHPRRSLAIHFIPSQTKYSAEKKAKYIYGRYKKFNSNEMEEDFFPITYGKDAHRSAFIDSYLGGQ